MNVNKNTARPSNAPREQCSFLSVWKSMQKPHTKYERKRPPTYTLLQQHGTVPYRIFMNIYIMKDILSVIMVFRVWVKLHSVRRHAFRTASFFIRTLSACKKSRSKGSLTLLHFYFLWRCRASDCLWLYFARI